VRTYEWLRLALYSSHHKFQDKRNKRTFGVKPVSGKRIIHDDDELVDLWNFYVGLSVELKSYFKNCFERQANISKICYNFFVRI